MAMKQIVPWLLVCAPVFAQAMHTTRLSLNVPAQCGLSVVSSTLRHQSDRVTGELEFRYKIRTARDSGMGSIAVTSAGASAGITVSALLAGTGTGSSAPQTVSPGIPVTVATFAPDSHSSSAGDTGTIVWSMAPGPVPRLDLTIGCQ